MNYHYCFKFIIIGDTAVGKSCILHRFLENKFRLKHDMTIGVEFGAKMIEIDRKTIKLQIWDTAGQETFKSITRQYYRSAAGAILVYDITRRSSFESIKDWLNECKTHGAPELEIIIVGNKCDCSKDRQVLKQEGESFAKEKGYFFIETSAKDNIGIQDVFLKASEKVYKTVHDKSKQSNSFQAAGVKLGAPDMEDAVPQKSKRRCC